MSARVGRKLYEKLKGYNVIVSDVIGRALEEGRGGGQGLAEEGSGDPSKVPPGEIVGAVGRSREER